MKACILRCRRAGPELRGSGPDRLAPVAAGSARRRSAPRGLALALLLAAASAGAEVVLDGSTGGGQAGALGGPDYAITEDLGDRVGDNLFHSFSQFDVAAGESATFSGAAGIDNVVGRVTGGDASHIDGTLRSSIDGANLYLINPAGMLFGDGASVDVRGAFHASSADWLEFTDGNATQRFEARAGGAIPRLLSASPTAFGFGDDNRAQIGVSGGVRLRGEAFHFTTRRLQLDGGQLNAGSDGAGDGGDIHIVADHLQMNGESEIGSDVEGGASGAAGDIFIEVDTALLRGSGEATPEISSDTEGSGDGGIIHIVARDSLSIVTDGPLPADESNLAGISTESKPDEQGGASGGAAGDIRIETGELRLDSGRIASGTATAGAGGEVVVAAQRIALSGAGGISSDTRGAMPGAGAGGDVQLSAQTIELRGEAEISSDVADGGRGAGGDIAIDSQRLALLGGGGATPEISSDTAGSGAGGRIDIRASESLLIRSGALDEGGDEPGGDGEQRAGIFSNTKPPQFSGVASGGAGGAIAIDAGRVLLDHAVIAANSQTSGAAGAITIAAGSELRLANAAEISVRSELDAAGVGDAGDVTASAVRIDLRGGSRISAHSLASDGGNVTLRAEQYLLLRDGALTADVGDNSGGDLNLTASSVVLDGGSATATAGAGRGGNIRVDGRHYLADGGRLDASADVLGIDGTVEVNAPQVDLSGSLEALETEFLDAGSLLRALCSARRSGQRLGSFTVVRQRGLPASAEGLALFGAAAKAPAPEARRLSGEARRAMLKRDWPGAARLLAAADAALGASADAAQWYTQIHLGRSQRLLASHPEYRQAALRRAHALLDAAQTRAAAVGEARAESYALGNLAELYRSQRRHREALYLASRALRAAERAAAPESVYRWHWLSGRLLWAEGRADEALAAWRRAVAILAETRQEALVAERDGGFFRRSVAPVYTDLADALLRSASMVGDAAAAQRLLREGRAVMEQFKAAELRDYFGDPCIAELEASERALDEVSPRAAVVYPVMLRRRTELLVSTPEGIERYVAEVGRRELESLARRFRAALQRADSEQHLALGRQLYDWLLAPWLDALQARGVDTLVFVPDGALRGIPLAALHDGRRYLIERVAVAIAPGMDLVDPRPLPRGGLQPLLAGVSESVQGYPALPKVAEELAAVAALHGGEVLLDGDFSTAALAGALARRQPSVLHIASHAEFGGEPQNSYLLTHDGRLSLAELGELVGTARFREQPLELLVLSACQTAIGDDRAALGLAGAALQAGARSVLGSLWSVSDEATFRLIEQFYRVLQAPPGGPRTGRAAALAEAQRALLAQAEFRHPVYWAPFLLISSWL